MNKMCGPGWDRFSHCLQFVFCILGRVSCLSAMICCLIHILGLLAGLIGMVLTWVVTFMPQWRLVILAEYNGLVVPGGRVDGEWISRWDGLWYTCIRLPRLDLFCENWGSQVSLTTDLRAARILMSFATGVAVLAFIFSIVGFVLTECCQCCCKKVSDIKKFTLAAGLLYILSTILVLIPVIWTTVYIAHRAYEASFTRQAVRIEIGDALMVAWPNIAFLLGGGIILTFLCCFCVLSTCCTNDPCEEPASCQQEDAKQERVSYSPRMEYL
ncbi:claudin-8-like [Hyla sarda]|uniref:claudin-8-like n=1 Tax=Hyla sarda TaxID=327740 RepID=UPI0024C21877|nr:claudin-8-like [Hyla sarda]